MKKDKLIEKQREMINILNEMASFSTCITNTKMMFLRNEKDKYESEISSLESEIKEKDEPKMSAEEILAGYMYQYFPTGHIYSGYMFYEKIAVVDAMEKYANQFKQ